MSDELEPLKPLSADEQAIFEGRRESAAVVQHRCPECKRWWETRKGNQVMREAFLCDCGNRMEFEVPALDAARPLTNAEILDALDPDQRLDTGMKVKEAVARARAWWEATGRKMMVNHAARQAEEPGGAGRGQGAAFASRDPNDPRFLPSGIIHGDAWDLLDKRSRLMVVKTWHHFNIRKPDVIGGADEVHKIQDRNKIN